MSEQKLAAYSRIQLLQVPTPFYRLEGLSSLFRLPVYIKRDDLTGVGAGGNKARKLEYLLADARQHGAQCVVSGGGIQSNHAAMVAVCSRRIGVACHLALVEAVPVKSSFYDEGGNIAIDRLCDARIRRFPADRDPNEYVALLAREIEETEGHAPYRIPMGGSNGTGALGYVRAAIEYARQLDRCADAIDTVLLPSGSAGTQAGLIVGFAIAGLEHSVIGISVLHTEATLRGLVLELCERLADMLDLTGIDWNARISIDDSFVGPGYGLPTRETWESIRKLIAADGVICDPVYTGKALHGFLTYLGERRPSLGRGVSFWHTGGLAGLFGYADQIESAHSEARTEDG
jgi:D-cysteine desulfhydrase family pyridoxal phosphate-dependent enzyme